MSSSYDAIIVETGQAGPSLAGRLTAAGKKVAVIERRWVGGSCPAVACMPSKNEIWSARVAHLARNAGAFGALTGPVSIDMEKRNRWLSTQRPAPFAWQTQDLNPSGAVGDSRLATVEKGEQLISTAVEALLRDVAAFGDEVQP